MSTTHAMQTLVWCSVFYLQTDDTEPTLLHAFSRAKRPHQGVVDLRSQKKQFKLYCSVPAKLLNSSNAAWHSSVYSTETDRLLFTDCCHLNISDREGPSYDGPGLLTHATHHTVDCRGQPSVSCQCCTAHALLCLSHEEFSVEVKSLRLKCRT